MHKGWLMLVDIAMRMVSTTSFTLRKRTSRYYLGVWYHTLLHQDFVDGFVYIQRQFPSGVFVLPLLPFEEGITGSDKYQLLSRALLWIFVDREEHTLFVSAGQLERGQGLDSGMDIYLTLWKSGLSGLVISLCSVYIKRLSVPAIWWGLSILSNTHRGICSHLYWKTRHRSARRVAVQIRKAFGDMVGEKCVWRCPLGRARGPSGLLIPSGHLVSR